MAGILLAPLGAATGFRDWLKERPVGSHDNVEYLLPAEIADLAPCSPDCWRVSAIGARLRHSEVATYYDLFCPQCVERVLVRKQDAVIDLALAPTGSSAAATPLLGEGEILHPPGWDTRRLAAELGIVSHSRPVPGWDEADTKLPPT